MVGAVSGSSYNNYEYFFDAETKELSKKGTDGELETLSAAEQEQVLAAAGLAVGSNGLVDSITGDTFEMSDSRALNARLSVGGNPVFTDSNVNTTSLAPDVRAACELLDNMNGSTTSLMLTQMMVLLKIAHQDKQTNDELLQTTDSMKLLSKDDEKAAKARGIEAEKEQATVELVGALGSAALRMTAAIAQLSMKKPEELSKEDMKDPTKRAEIKEKNEQIKESNKAKTFLKNIAEGSSPLFNSYSNMFSYLCGAKNDEHIASIDEQNAQKNTEAISQLQTYIKEAQRDVQNNMKGALQLIKDVAERQVENIKAMTTA